MNSTIHGVTDISIRKGLKTVDINVTHRGGTETCIKLFPDVSKATVWNLVESLADFPRTDKIITGMDVSIHRVRDVEVWERADGVNITITNDLQKNTIFLHNKRD